LGDLRLVWNQRGLVRLCLPGADPRGAGLSTAQQAPLPPWGEELALGLHALAAGAPADFRAVPLALDALTEFQREVLAACADLAWGEVVTYGELAKRTGRKATAARAVGGALSKNPVPLVVPCHRVVGASGALTGFTAPGGVETKRRLLLLENRA
ncbi:MAG: MGMT family protein, partial [Planctomycetes bacterium]|nr:MGMT family protein [Planctomycetota bacterium]